MADFVFTADWHLGKGWPFKIDPVRSVSKRVDDIIENVEKIVTHTLECGAPLMLVGGDVFEHTHVRPYFREVVRAKVIEPLVEQGIRVVLLAGNHDQPRNPVRGTSLDDFRGYAGVTVIRDRPRVMRIEAGGGEASLIMLPYLHPELLSGMVTEDESIPADTRDKVASMRQAELFEIGRSLLAGYLQNRVQEAAADGVPSIIVGHYFVEAENIRISSITNPRTPPGEFGLPPNVIPGGAEFSLMGHVHLHQELELSGGRRIVYCGSPERLTWNEYMDEKGFMTVEIGEKASWQFHPLQCRQMVSPRITIPDGVDPTEHLLSNIPPVEGALVRLDVDFPQGGRMRLRNDDVDRALEGAMHYELKWKERTREEAGSGDFNLTPSKLFSEYILQNYQDHPLREELQREGEDALREVL